MTRIGNLGRFALSVALLAPLGGCGDPTSKGSTINVEGDGGDSGEAGSGAVAVGATPTTSEPTRQWGFDAFTPLALEGTGGTGEGGAAPQRPLVAPYGISLACGDGIVGLDENGELEECDDGQGGAQNELDACTDECQTRDQPGGLAPTVELPSDRYLGAGRHPVAGLDQGFIATYVNVGGDEPSIGASLFNIWGQPAHQVVVSDGASPIYDANPVAAALPDGSYVVAWGDFDGDGSDLGIALRRVDGDGVLGALRAANAATEFSQLNPDMIWTGTELVVAWEDYADPATGPDLRVRTFDGQLNATSSDLVLAETALPEAAVALAPFNGDWAAAYREGLADGTENVVVRVGEQSFRVGPVLGGPLDDRPALVELDETHLLLVFSAAANTDGTVPRLRYSVIDTESEDAPTFQALEPLDDVLTSETQVTHLSPAAAKGADGYYVAWRSEARSGDSAGDQLWLRYLSWDAQATPALEVRESEQLIPRVCEASVGDQRTPALARVELPPEGALAIAWDDYARGPSTTGGEPDVVLHYAPTHERAPERGRIFEERFTALDAPNWPAHWTREEGSAQSATLQHSIKSKEGQTYAPSGSPGGTVLMHVNRHSALNVEMESDVRFAINSARGGFMARRDDQDPDTYLVARFGPHVNTKFQLYAVIDGVVTVLDEESLPYLFTLTAQDADFHMRMRVENLPSGELFLGFKFWEVELSEPSGWVLEATLSASSDEPFRTVYEQFANRAGRFGLVASLGQAGRMTTFDDFRARFFEGNQALPLEDTFELPTPLRRAPASYRTCTDAEKCGAGGGCCFADSECGAGLRCRNAESELFGFGSHTKTCSQEHCGNLRLDADELRADCGGADCAPCDPTCKVGPSGTLGLCTGACPCGVGEGDCAGTTACLPGLICLQRGFNFGNIPTADDVCVPQHCKNRKLDTNVLNGHHETPNPDCGGECGGCEAPPGYCTVYDKCEAGGSDCDQNDQCQAGLVCGSGARWNVEGNACNGAHCSNNVLDGNETSVDCGGDCGPICL